MAIKEHDWTLTDDAVGKAANTILTRLEHNLNNMDYARTVRRSTYERSKARAVSEHCFKDCLQSSVLIKLSSCTQNLEYAQTLITRLEQVNTTSHSTRTSRQQAQNIIRQRDVLKQCDARLRELDLEADTRTVDASSDEDAPDEDTQELLRRFAPQANVGASIDTRQETDYKPTKNSQPEALHAPPASEAQTATLRSRRTDTSSTAHPSTTASKGTTSSLQISPFAPKSTTSTTLLEAHTSTQEDLTSSLLDLARALNASTKSFSTSLEASNPLVDSATSALDRNVTGMEAAERRMGMLRRITEGKGWFGRLSLWAWIAVGWMALLVVMFILPKLRL